MNELISIIVPIYNVEEYLDRCINSIVNQTYRNIEILLIDDGSKDNSGKISDEWAKKDDRIRVFHKENGGLSDARNYGIDRAKGAIYSFIDSDDYVDEKFIEIMYENMIATGSQISAVGYKKFTDKDAMNVSASYVDNTVTMTSLEALNTILDNSGFTNYVTNKIFRKELFDGVRYPVGKKVEDLGTTYKLVDKCDSIAYNKSELLFYYQRAESILGQGGKDLYRDMYELASQRFYDIEKKYPSNFHNYKCYLHMGILCYKFHNAEEKKRIINQSKLLWKVVKKECGIKVKVKYWIFRIFPMLGNAITMLKHKK